MATINIRNTHSLVQQTIDIRQALVEGCRKGDRKAQYELYQMYARGMYNICMRMVNHEAEAEDILQESFIDAFRTLDHFRAEVTFGAWMKRIVVNKCISYLRKKKLELVENIPDAVDAIYEEENTNWDVKKVHRAIQELPDGYRVVLSLYLLEGYDHGEIAQILNITESTSKSQYNRAKTKLRTQLMKSHERQF